MARFLDRLKNYLTTPPLPSAAFQVSANQLSGICASPKEKKIKHYFISPLNDSVIQPSFDKKNLKDEPYLEEKIRKGKQMLHLSENKIACLIPERCLKVFVFSFVSLPSAQMEREQIIRWQLKKQMPQLPDDARLSYEVIKSNKDVKILVSLAKTSVIEEYENLFARAGLKLRVVGITTLSLFSLLGREDGNLMVLNLEEDYIALMAVLNSEIVMYRLKPFVLEGKATLSLSERINNVVQEVENTINFIEDREKKKIDSVRIRLGTANQEKEILSVLKESLSPPIKGIETSLASELDFRESQILSPLIGQILC